MSELVANCPRCGSVKMTFDLKSSCHVATEYGWKRYYEAFCVCRHCDKSTVFRLSSAGIPENEYIDKVGGISRVDGSATDSKWLHQFEGYGQS